MSMRYVVGIDVGTHSTGFCAFEVDDEGFPIRILNAVVFRHDSGVDPQKQKTAMTRLAVSGQMRRTRRLIRRRRKRYQALDDFLTSQGWGLGEVNESDPYAPWRIRAALAESRIDEDEVLFGYLAAALRHMIRHRGWRNPYSRVESLLRPAEESPQLLALRQRVDELAGDPSSDNATVAQLVASVALDPTVKLRGPDGLLGGKLMQSDNANELRRIWDVQELDEELLDDVIRLVFDAESPRGSAVARVGKDPLPGQGGMPRAPKADPAFQEFRIVSIAANLRIREPNAKDRRLTAEELRSVTALLREWEGQDPPTWADVAGHLAVDRTSLRGTSATTADGERASARPPIDQTNLIMGRCKVRALAAWWKGADEESRSAMIDVLTEGDRHSASSDYHEEAESFLETLSDEDLAKLEEIPLPAGRAAYSRNSLQRLTRWIIANGSDITAARIGEFGVAPDWVPPAVPVGEPVGNPAVDRVLKGVARWLQAVEYKWGAPLSVNIEHVRNALISEAQARALDRENNARFQHNERIKEELASLMGGRERPTYSDVTRYLAVTRQNCECLYCGGAITFSSCELDHIVPRAGAGSTNRRDNLVAVCEECNRSKSNVPFAVWASRDPRPGVSLDQAIERLKFFLPDPGRNEAQTRQFVKGIRERLSQKESDPAIDARSMESVAWMANELRHRIEQHYRADGHETTVRVFRGGLTAEARRASGIDGQLALMGGTKKTRFDRRHHAVDAAVIAMMRPGIAQVLAERVAIREAQRLTRHVETWKGYEGSSREFTPLYRQWRLQMERVLELVNDALREDQIPVRQNLRLRLGNGAAHDDTIRPLVRRSLSDAMPADIIDRASTPALWCALTRLPDFDPVGGLPVDETREIRVYETTLRADSEIEFFPISSAAIAVRGGYAEIGSTIHHARIYRLPGKKSSYGMVRVFAVDLVRHRADDLFSVELPAHSISLRTSEPKVRKAVLNGTAEYLGWLVTGDEILIDPAHSQSGAAGTFLLKWPLWSWTVDGFYSKSKLRLRPTLLAAEGLTDDASAAERSTIDRPGWPPAVNVIFGTPGVEVVRRDALGRIRTEPSGGLPVSWTVDR